MVALNRLAVGLMASILILLGAQGARAQDQTLTTPTPSNNGGHGAMFDVVAANTVTVKSFRSDSMVAGPVSIYGRPGTHVGFENSAVGWTLLASGAITSGVDQPITANVNVTIPAGQTYAFYLASQSGNGIRYSNGVGGGTVLIADANISILEGVGKSTPSFTGTTFQSRALAGSVIYAVGVAPVPTVSEWALILLGLTLAGCAALVIQRRRSPV